MTWCTRGLCGLYSQHIYDILLQEGAGVYHLWIYDVSDVVQEGAVWPLRPDIYIYILAVDDPIPSYA